MTGDDLGRSPSEVFLRRGLAVLVAAALLWVLGQVVVTLSTVLIPLAAAVLLAALLAPEADRLVRHRVPRALATAIVVVVGLVAVAGLLSFAVVSVSGSLPELQARLTDSLNQLRATLSGLGVRVPPTDQLVTQVRDFLAHNTGRLVTAFTSLGAFLGGGLLALFILVFLVYEGRGIWCYLLRAVPRGRREATDEAGLRSWGALTQYVRTTGLIALIDAVLIGVALWIVGVPLVLTLAALTFLGGFVPFVGAIVAGVAAVLVALVMKGLTAGIIVLGVVLAVQQLEGNVLQPWLQGNAVKLHPLAVVLAVTIGLNQAGIIGALLAVPLLAVIKTAVQTFAGHGGHRGGHHAEPTSHERSADQRADARSSGRPED